MQFLVHKAFRGVG